MFQSFQFFCFTFDDRKKTHYQIIIDGFACERAKKLMYDKKNAVKALKTYKNCIC